ncbi:hypothetical protein C8J57DRAFT_1661661 [Mycena rebaudengoi]|nr:hypothetical protein C8J57DRAFT_1661661 [Mycena rebaudengoi]
MPVNLNNNPVSVSSHIPSVPMRPNTIVLPTIALTPPRLPSKGRLPKEGMLDLLTFYAFNIAEVLASSMDPFAAFASMDMVFAHHHSTLPVTYTAQGPPSRRISTSRSRPFAHCVTSGPILPSPAVGFCPPGGSEWGSGAEQRRAHERQRLAPRDISQGEVVGTVANGGNATSGGRAEAYPRIVRTAPGAPTWPPAPAARTLDLRVHFASAIEARWPPLADPVLSVQSFVSRRPRVCDKGGLGPTSVRTQSYF